GGDGLPQQRGTVSLAARLELTRGGLDRGYCLGPRLDYADKGTSRQSPATYPLLVVPPIHLREHRQQRVTQPLRPAATNFQFAGHFIDGEADPGRRQMAGQSQQPFRRSVTHTVLSHALLRHRNHLPAPTAKPIGWSAPARPVHSVTRRRNRAATSIELPWSA